MKMFSSGAIWETKRTRRSTVARIIMINLIANCVYTYLLVYYILYVCVYTAFISVQFSIQKVILEIHSYNKMKWFLKKSIFPAVPQKSNAQHNRIIRHIYAHVVHSNKIHTARTELFSPSQKKNICENKSSRNLYYTNIYIH